jgi:hypothetical protein
MTRLLTRLAATAALAIAVFAIVAPSSLAVPVDPNDGSPYYAQVQTAKKKKARRANAPLSRCRDQLVRPIGCPIPG